MPARACHHRTDLLEHCSQDVEHLPHHRIKAVGGRALDANLVAQAATSASACSCCREINSSVTD
jgi:hypothetical protein